MYTVYKHIAPNGKVYIGITQQDVNVRWQGGNGYRRQAHFYSAIKKYGWNEIKHEIIAVGLKKEDAEQTEIALIKQHKSNDRRYGYNIENGGNSIGKVSEDTKKKMSLNRTGNKNPMYNKPKSELQKKRALEANRRCVVMIDAKKGIVLKKYDSIKNAADDVGGCWQSISRSCRGKSNTAYGYIWMYKSEVAHEVIMARIKRAEIRPDCKKVAKMNREGDVLEIYDSVSIASKYNDITTSKISECCNGTRKSASGYLWKFIGETSQ